MVSLVALALGSLAGFLFNSYTSEKYEFLSSGEKISSCLADSTLDVAVDKAERDERLNFCYQKIRWQSSLDDYSIRRWVFQNQLVADIVLLWVVVSITLSGVVLAALQLYTSYRIAMSGKGASDGSFGSSFEMERGKVALKSSVTGLFIILFSFGFFYVYVIFVYKISVPEGPPLANTGHTPVAQRVLPLTGGIGPPPSGESTAQATGR